MSDGTLKVGDGLLLRKFTDHPTPNLRLDYNAPAKRGEYHLALWLGIWSEEKNGTVNQRLNALGWVFDPERAHKASAEANAARDGAE